MNAAQHEELIAEMRQQSGLLARIADRLAPAGDGSEYRPAARDMAGEMRGLWLDETGEAYWVVADAPHEYAVRDRGWKRAYVRRDGR